MLTAVQFVHERGLLHLDIKPVRRARHSTPAAVRTASASFDAASRPLIRALAGAQENFCVLNDRTPVDDAKARRMRAPALAPSDAAESWRRKL